MKFRPVKRFTGDPAGWLGNELNSALRELYIGLANLTFGENFKSFTWTGTIAAGVDLQIVHPFQRIPTGYSVHKQVGNGLITAGPTAWTSEVVYLTNNGAVSVDATVIFFA